MRGGTDTSECGGVYGGSAPEIEFRAAQAQLKDLREQLRQGVCRFEVWYFDEAGFALTPTVPYAWQLLGERIELESVGNQGKRQNVLGFLRSRRRGFLCGCL
jgi:hypothetical protein